MTRYLERVWRYPRVTPYRLVVMLTTAGLGIAKAVVVSRNQTVSSITIEWITGVVVALLYVALFISLQQNFFALSVVWTLII